MGQGEHAQTLKAIAAEAFAALGNAAQIPPFSSRPQGLSVDDAYRVTPLVRQMYEASGAKVLGRKTVSPIARSGRSMASTRRSGATFSTAPCTISPPSKRCR